MAEAARAKGGDARFVSGDLMRHVATMSAAGSVGLVAVFLVDLADLFFISLLGEAELAAAVGFAGAIVFLTTSVGIGLAIATGALSARAIGAGDPERARVIATHTLVNTAAVSVATALVVWMLIPQLVALVGATGETARLAERYLSIVVPSFPLMAMMMMGGALLRAHGDARRSMNTTLTAAAVNGVLDPILIFGLWAIPALGLDGAAIATVIARAAGAAVAFAPIVSRHGGFAPLEFAAFRSDLSAIFQIAGPAVLTNTATPIGAVFITRLIADFGDAAVAGYAIIGRLTPVSFALVFALSGAVGPIVGQNVGAGRYDRVRETLTASAKFLGGYVLIVSALLFLFAGAIADAFQASDDARTLIFWFCGPLSLAFFFNGLLFVANASFNNLGRPVNSTLFNWGRHTLGAMPTAWAGAALFGAPGVLIGQALGGVVFGLLAMRSAYGLVDRSEQAARAADGEAPVVERRPSFYAALAAFSSNKAGPPSAGP